MSRQREKLQTRTNMLIAQISDPHVTLPGDPLDQLFETASNLQRAVDHIVNLSPPPDVVFVTGDCVSNETVEEYERFRRLIQPLEMPVYVIPGNHDDREHMRAIFGEQGTKHHEDFIQFVVQAGPLRLIALDTQIPGEPNGLLCSMRLDWLEERLAEDTESPTLLFQHHPPFKIGIPVADQIGMKDVEDYGRLIAKHANIERILAGHVHCHVQRRFQGTIALTCPSTSLQTHVDLSQQNTLAAVMSTPACLLHYWSAKTGLVTYTSPIGDHGPVRTVYDGKEWLKLT